MSPSKLLIVEDYDPFCQLLQSMLRSPHLEIVGQASDGLVAIEKAQSLQPDLILLDISLPKLNGIKAAEKIMQIIPQVKILFLSQESAPDFVTEAFRLGARGYVHKSNAQRELIPAIERVLSGKSYVSTGLRSHQPRKDSLGCPPDNHEMLLFSSEDEMLQGFSSFIACALEKQSPTITILSPALRDRLLERLRKSGAKIDAAIRQGTYAWFDSTGELNVDELLGLLQELSHAAPRSETTGRPRFACCGERAGRLWAEGRVTEALEIERFCNQLSTEYECEMLCAYCISDAEQKALPSFSKVFAEHSQVRF